MVLISKRQISAAVAGITFNQDDLDFNVGNLLLEQHLHQYRKRGSLVVQRQDHGKPRNWRGLLRPNNENQPTVQEPKGLISQEPRTGGDEQTKQPVPPGRRLGSQFPAHIVQRYDNILWN